MNTPLVSIIIPAYNSAKYLPETIQSALDQTWPNKEIIIVDDGSLDDTAKIASDYAAKNAGINVICQENKGASAARNAGLKEAKGDYIQFLDADDLLSPDKIACQVETLEKNPGMVAISSTIHIKNHFNPEATPSDYEEAFLINDTDPAHFLINLWGGYSRHGSIITIHSWLTPRSIIDKAGWWDERLSLDDDGEFFCRVILNSKGILKTEGINYYRKYDSEKNLSSQSGEKGLKSSLLSVLSKKKHLFEKKHSPEAGLAIHKQLTGILVNSYLRYPSIYETAKRELPNIDPVKYLPTLGGPITTRLSQLFGWRFTMFLRIKLYPLTKK